MQSTATIMAALPMGPAEASCLRAEAIAESCSGVGLPWILAARCPNTLVFFPTSNPKINPTKANRPPKPKPTPGPEFCQGDVSPCESIQ